MQLGEKEIGGHNYSVGYWDVDTSTATLTRLFKILGEPLGKVLLGALEGKEEGQSLLDVKLDENQGKFLSEAISGLSMRLNEDEVKNLLRQCCKQLLCDGKQIDYNTHFMGKIGHLFKVCLFVLRHQYSDFLGESLGQ